MEAPQDAQAVLGGQPPQFALELVEALPEKLTVPGMLGCGLVVGLLLLAGLLRPVVPGWALGGLALLGLALS